MLIEKLFIVALAVSVVSVTLAKFSIAKGFRDWLVSLGPQGAELAYCHFCLSFYVAALLTPWVPVHLGPWGLANVLISGLANVALAALISSVMIILGRAANNLWASTPLPSSAPRASGKGDPLPSPLDGDPTNLA